MNYDIIIRKGRVISGMGNPWFYSQVGIKDGKIVSIKNSIDGQAKREINAENLIVCPGFIDIHAHTDYALPFSPKMDSFIHQGITTSVLGMCGTGLAPITDEKLKQFERSFSSFTPKGFELELSWRTFSEYLNHLEKNRYPANLVSFVGYENVRIAGGPGYENRTPTSIELNAMKNYVDEAMKAGAFGLSTGLIYAPQIFANKQELIELCKVAAENNGYYFSHIRGASEYLIEGLKEFIEIVEKSGVMQGQIAHYKVAGKKNWGTSQESLALIEKANNKGLDITFDQYPYVRSMSELITVLPPWARKGGVEQTVKYLTNDKSRARIKKDIINGIEGWENWIRDNGFENIYLSMAKTDNWREMLGKNISEITKIKGYKNNWKTFFEILVEEKNNVSITIHSMSEDDIRTIMRNRYQMFGTDGVAVPHIPEIGKVHPRFYGTYPRVLGKYVREENVLTLEEAIRKMTSFPAQRLGIHDRGKIALNCWADLVIFNPKTIIDKATFNKPHQYPDGIEYVIVNGEIVIDNKKRKRKRPGKILRHQNTP